MENEKGGQKPGQMPDQPTDKGEDAEERREAAERAWKDRAGVPRGTPEQGKQSADRVGGTGTTQPEPEVEDESQRSERKSQRSPTEKESPTKKNA
jgi:hypothetical protein